jgi:hypothetical protein
MVCQTVDGVFLPSITPRYNGPTSTQLFWRKTLADEKLYKAEYLGSGTFAISKPKRKKIKVRQSQLKNPQRGSRK